MTVNTVTLLAVCASVEAAGPITPKPQPPVSISKLHQQYIKYLSKEQKSILDSSYPDFQLVAVCPGNFSGDTQNELVIGIWTPVESGKRQLQEIHRVGLVYHELSWSIHSIDDELEKDRELSNSYPMRWDYKLNDETFVADMKCGINSEFSKDSDLTYSLGDKPFFSLQKTGLSKNKIACFATSDVYNNWDCVVYDPKEQRFKLWYQQAHAD